MFDSYSLHSIFQLVQWVSFACFFYYFYVAFVNSVERGWIKVYASVCVVLWNTDTRGNLRLVTCESVLSRNSI